MNPKLVKIRQRFKSEKLTDIAGELSAQLEGFKGTVAGKKNIAIAVGSRGIANLVQIVKQTVVFLKQQGGEPFIVPAMGSHGGARAEGQAELLAGFGITQKEVGAEVKSSMEVVELESEGLPVAIYMDKHAYESDGVILINRIKPHTSFHNRYESGLVKMSVIGLGNQEQAAEIHSHGLAGLKKFIPIAAEKIIALGKILGGVAIVENAYDETMLLQALAGEQIMPQEPQLLETAKANMPKLPIEDIDILIVDRMGKDISGLGMDPNIIGRLKIPGQPEPETPKIKSIVVCDLTEETHGNALGVGLADVATMKLLDKLDFEAMYANAYTTTFLERAKCPVIAQNPQKAFDFAVRSCGRIEPDKLKVIRIRDTLHLDEVFVSDAVAQKLDSQKDVEITGTHLELFDSHGQLRPIN